MMGMLRPSFTTMSPIPYALQQLQVLRGAQWLAQAVTLLLAYRWLGLHQLYALLALLVVQLTVMAASHGRLLRSHEQPEAVGEREFCLQLSIDSLVLTGLLYVAGGATNPFVSYYLVPVALSASILPRYYTVVLAVFCVTAYSVLLFFYQPLQALSPHAMHAHGSGPGLHVLGMWINFGLSALLITYFVAGLAHTIRQQREHINRLREQQLMDENILAVATLAAGTAHELGTPLSSAMVVLQDLLQRYGKDGALGEDLSVMAGQLDRCRHSLRQLVDTARQHQDGVFRRQPVHALVERLMRDWQVLRPGVNQQWDVQSGPNVDVMWPLTVEQALINLLDNAADAGDLLDVQVKWDARLFCMTILDNGSGMETAATPVRGRLIDSGKERGLGLGLLLSHASLEQAGGSLTLRSRPGGGTVTEVRLPLEAAHD